MAQYLPQSAGSSNYAGDFTPRVTQYLTTAVNTEALGVRNHRELQTLAQSLDAILRNDILLAADTLMQRFKSIELASHSQSWAVAQHMELTPAIAVAATAGRELKAATKEELTARRLAREGRPEATRRSPEIFRIG